MQQSKRKDFKEELQFSGLFLVPHQMSHPTVFLVFAAEIWPTHPSSQPPRELEFLNLLILLISVYLPYFTSRHRLSKTFSNTRSWLHFFIEGFILQSERTNVWNVWAMRAFSDVKGF